MDAAADLGKNPVSKHQIQPEYEDEQANTGRDCQNRVARPNSPTTVGVEKRGAYKLVHGDLPRQQHSFETTLRFTGPVPADSRQ